MTSTDSQLLDIASRERGMLVRYCARFTSDPFIAEDLAQQAMLEAWQKSDQLYNQEVRAYWLLGMARRVCLRWSHSHRLDASRFVLLDTNYDEADSIGAEESFSDDFDLEVELERHDLARLLDRAMALLPPETREVLVRKYIEESPQLEVAERLGLSESAVEARLHRGKLALRKILTTDLKEEASSYGLISPETEGWQETRIWCPDCGQRRLYGRLFPGEELQLDCIDCPAHGGERIRQVRARGAARAWGIDLSVLLTGVKGYKAAWNRLRAALYPTTIHGVCGVTVQCPVCSGEVPLKIKEYSDTDNIDVRMDCPHCGHLDGITTAYGIAHGTPEAWKFWSEHPRSRSLPIRKIEVSGSPALATGLESITDNARIDVVLVRDTLQPIGVYGAPEGQGRSIRGKLTGTFDDLSCQILVGSSRSGSWRSL